MVLPTLGPLTYGRCHVPAPGGSHTRGIRHPQEERPQQRATTDGVRCGGTALRQQPIP